MKAMKLITLAVLALLSLGAIAQPPTGGTGGGNVLDPTKVNGLLKKDHPVNRTPIAYPQLREADLMYEKWVWRTVDIREKINHPFYYPIEPVNNRANLITTVLTGIKEGTITAYDAFKGSGNSDEFDIPLTKDEVAKIGNRIDSLQIPDLENPDILRDTVVISTLRPQDIVRWYFKEIWFFDKQRSVMDVRIIGMCPVLNVYTTTGEYKGESPMFWIYFPQARNVFARTEIYNRFNDAGRLTWDDIFWKRIFSSYITKESNVFDRRIADYKTGMDALIESDRIKTDIMNMEHDLWDF